MPITERASTGLQIVSDCALCFTKGETLQSNMVLDTRAGHENHHNGSKK
jgi:hypothetical protein